MRLAYPIELTAMTPEDGGGWLVTFPDWNNAVTDGADVDEAMANATDCLETMIDYHLRKELDIPTPGDAQGRRLVVPEADLAMKAALWRVFRASRLTNASLAEQVGVPPDHLHKRLFHPRARPRPELLRDVAAALGKRIVLELEDAA